MITLTEIYNECRELGIISTQNEFSEFCGKARSWYSSTISRNRRLTIDVLHKITWELHDTYMSTVRDAEVTQDEEYRQSLVNGIEALERLMGRVQIVMDSMVRS